MLYGFNIAIIQIWRKLVKSNSKISVSYNLPGKGAEKTGKFPPKKGLYPSCGGAFGENDGDIAKISIDKPPEILYLIAQQQNNETR
ncbi:hypothetical protein [Oscillibacter sp. CU971]|uniref:hypothetical protein n=1 Tax=Oscillibacter sp. CU971 TaxID=2780102 RepID=UPI0019596FE2|nr:hypothetical protein [Oscillibacter sp. CU971]